MNTELEIVAAPETKLAIAHLKLVEILTTLDPSSRNKKLRNGFKKVRVEAETLVGTSWALGRMSDELLRDIYRLIDLLTVELASTSMMADAIREADLELPSTQAQRQTGQTQSPQ